MKAILLPFLLLPLLPNRGYTVVDLVLVNACNCTLAFTKGGKPTEAPRVLHNKPTRDTVRLEIEKGYSGFSLQCSNGGGDITVPYTPGKTIWLTADFTGKKCK